MRYFRLNTLKSWKNTLFVDIAYSHISRFEVWSVEMDGTVGMWVGEVGVCFHELSIAISHVAHSHVTCRSYVPL